MPEISHECCMDFLFFFTHFFNENDEVGSWETKKFEF